MSDSRGEQGPRNVLSAIVGQPNSGKSTLFHLLTRIHQEVGNYPGMTVDAKSGHYHEGKYRIELVDLPGTYSLQAATPEERIAGNFVLFDRPEVVIDVLDASNFRRHLFLLIELLEMQIPLIVCLNFFDAARRRRITFDLEKLRARLGVPVVPMVASRGENLAELRGAILAAAEKDQHEPTEWRIDYGDLIEPVLGRIERAIRKRVHLSEDFSPRWLAVRLLENDRETRRLVEHHTHGDDWRELLDFCDEELNLFIEEHRLSPRKLILERRYELAQTIDHEVVTRSGPKKIRFSDRIDAVACHPIFGPLLLFALLALTFQLTFRVADGWKWVPSLFGGSFAFTTPVEFLAALFHHTIPDQMEALFHLTDGPLSSLLREGVLAGMGGVIQFVPVIFVMFSLLAALEQSGYIARVAMIMDRFMRRFNLQGQSILPMVLGGGLSGGCAVPAIMTTRSITNTRQRLLTILAIPMLNCGGKIPVYAMLIGAFFASRQGMVMASMVVLSWVIALLSALLLGKTVVRGKNPPLLLELPAYQLPRLGEVIKSAARQSGEFLKKAGTVILAANILLWFLMSYPRPAEVASAEVASEGASAADAPAHFADSANIADAEPFARRDVLEQSYAASFGRAIEPISRLAGFDWKDNVALFGGLATKELIVSSMTTLYRPEAPSASANGEIIPEKARPKTPETLKSRLSRAPGASPVKALAMLLFVMLYAPCSGTLVAIHRVTDSWRWPLFSFVFNTTLGFLLAALVYQLAAFFR